MTFDELIKCNEINKAKLLNELYCNLDDVTNYLQYLKAKIKE